jgi:hypothetical protein
MEASRIQHLWRKKRRLDMLPSPNRYALSKLVADLLPAAAKS